MNRGSIGDDRDEPGKTGAPPGKTGAAPGTTGTAPPRQSYGNAPVNAVRKTGALPERHRHSPGLRRGITSDDRALPGSDDGIDKVSAGGVTVYRGSAGFHRGTTGDNRGYAGTLPAFTGALPATTGALTG
ncbi:hypothetical protein DPMN_075017 [Dreissena polymorpha]|uniref:Uncharacterized protein n=1 Tax=Dreissena polymorpha TaxID=45954 RepID=A0A9D4BM87_DREPO|nr:hypothetical protein DPMN_075017 [Dreissena polymorpha]